MFLYLLFAIPSAKGQESMVWHNVDTMQIEGKAWRNTAKPYQRLPAKAEKIVREPVWRLASNTAGLHVFFTTDARNFEVKWTLLDSTFLSMPHMPATGVSGIDVYYLNPHNKWLFLNNGQPQSKNNRAKFSARQEGETTYLLYFPLYNGVTKMEIGIPASATFYNTKYYKDEQKPIVFYGTSITQGGCASRPGLAYTGIINRKLHYPVINLGFSGNGNMEKEMIDLISEIDAALFVFDCHRNMTPEQVKNRTEPAIRIIRKKHPQTPILLVEEANIYNEYPTERGLIMQRVYNTLKIEGVPNLYMLRGNKLLGNDTEGTVDTIHPNDIGFMIYAYSFLKIIKTILYF